jgi:hypothetical protein
MSNVRPDAEKKGASQSDSSAAKETNLIRLVVLLLIFGVALVGLLYDYCVARPAHHRATQTIFGLLTGTTADPDGDGAITDDEVQSIMGCKPSKIEMLRDGKIEVYSWRSGLPYRCYDLYVVYLGHEMPLLHFASTRQPQPGELPPVATTPSSLTGKTAEP